MVVEAHNLGGVEVRHQDGVVGVGKRKVEVHVEIESDTPSPLAGKLETRKFDERKKRVADLSF